MRAFAALCVCALAVSAVCIALERRAPELAFTVSLALSAVSLLWVLELLQGEYAALFARLGVGGQAGCVLKAAALSVLGKHAADSCRGGGQAGAANAVELAATAAVLAVSRPVIEELLALAAELLA